MQTMLTASLINKLPRNVENFLMLISIDDDRNTVLSFGILNDSLRLEREQNETNGHGLPSKDDRLSAGIKFSFCHSIPAIYRVAQITAFGTNKVIWERKINSNRPFIKNLRSHLSPIVPEIRSPQLSGYYQKAIKDKEYGEQQFCKALLLVYKRRK